MICSRCTRILRQTLKRVPIRFAEETCELAGQKDEVYREKVLPRLEPLSQKCWICGKLSTLINAQSQGQCLNSVSGSCTVEFVCVALLTVPQSGIIDCHVTMENVHCKSGDSAIVEEIELQLVVSSGNNPATRPCRYLRANSIGRS